MTTKISDSSKILQWERRNLTTLCEWGISWSMQQNNMLEDKILTPVPIPTMYRDMDEQLKLTHKVVDVVDRTNRKICVTLLRYNVEQFHSFYAQVRLFARKKEAEKFQQVVYVNCKLEEFIYLLDVMNSLYDKIITNQPNCNVL